MIYSITAITQYDDMDFIWVTVSIASENPNELGTYNSCEVKVSLKKEDLKLSEIEGQAIKHAKSFMKLALKS